MAGEGPHGQACHGPCFAEVWKKSRAQTEQEPGAKDEAEQAKESRAQAIRWVESRDQPDGGEEEKDRGGTEVEIVAVIEVDVVVQTRHALVASIGIGQGFQARVRLGLEVKLPGKECLGEFAVIAAGLAGQPAYPRVPQRQGVRGTQQNEGEPDPPGQRAGRNSVSGRGHRFRTLARAPPARSGAACRRPTWRARRAGRRASPTGPTARRAGGR